MPMNPQRARGPIGASAAALATALLLHAAPALAATADTPAPATPSTGPGFDLKAPGVDMSGVWEIEHYVGSGAPIERRILHDMEGKPAPFLP